jgi:hypothetical protein
MRIVIVVVVVVAVVMLLVVVTWCLIKAQSRLRLREKARGICDKQERSVSVTRLELLVIPTGAGGDCQA